MTGHSTISKKLAGKLKSRGTTEGASIFLWIERLREIGRLRGEGRGVMALKKEEGRGKEEGRKGRYMTRASILLLARAIQG